MPYDLSNSALHPVTNLFQPQEFPLATIMPPDQLQQIFGDLFYTNAESWTSINGLHIDFRLAFEGSLGFELPGLTGVSLLVAAGSNGWSTFAFESLIGPEPSLRLVDVPVTLRISRNYLQPMKSRTEIDSEKEAVDIDIAELNMGVSLDGVELDAEIRVDLPLCMIGDSGVLVLAQGVTVHLDDNHPAPNRPAGWRGVYIQQATLDLPGDLGAAIGQLGLQNAYISSGGFTGEISTTWAPQPLRVPLNDFQLDLHKVEIAFEQNALTKGTILGTLHLPFFEKPIGVVISLSLDGGFLLSLAPVQPPGVIQEGNLVIIEQPGVCRFAIDGLSLGVDDGVATIALSGEITPLFIVQQPPPKFRVRRLAIDSRGHIHLEGGWLSLRETYQINFHGFLLEISKLGFGNTENGGKWIGFSGGVKLVAGMPAGASVEGLRITWHKDGSIETTLKGVRVEFEVPKTLKFSGAVSYDSGLQQFRGAVKLDLIALKMQLDATAVFGTLNGKPYLATYLAAEFPAGIPLFATGLGIYGMAGLFAMNMEPKRAAGQEWYALGSTTDWYHSPPAVGVTSLEKWAPTIGSMAFGAGITLGTVADNGHTFSGRMLLVIIFPGPILMIQGSASLLQERTTLDRDANFRAIAVLDGRAGTFQLGLDAKYRYDNSGALIDINGAAEGFFNFNDPKAWRLNVGLKEPRERRLTARLFKLFNSYSYVMLDSQQLAMGAWIGFKQNWQFGPLSVRVEAWIDGNARVSWKPAHFYGDLWLHGSARLSAFGFSVGLTVDARIAADVFDPFHVRGQFSVKIDLPWPLSDISVNIKMEWGPQPTPPPLALPLKEIAIEHFKATTSWPLPRVARGTTPPLLLPNYDRNGDGFFDPPAGSNIPANLNAAPVVPLDCRPHITFARNVHDDALVGVNAQPVVPEFERIGDPVTNQGPARIRYGLEEIALEKLKDNEWRQVARKGKTANPPNVPTLFGSWAPMPQMPGGGGRNVGQVKLWLWSRTPFEFTRRSSRAWDEWFSDEYSGYPCQTLPGTAWDFENVEPNPRLPDPWQHSDEPGLSFTLNHDDIMSIQVLSRPSHGLTHAFGFSGRETSIILLPQPTNVVRIMVTDGRLVRASDFLGFGSGEKLYEAIPGGTPERPYIELRGIGINRIQYFCETFLRVPLVTGVAAAVGGCYVPSFHQLIVAEFHGRISRVDLITNEYKVIGTGYSNPEDVVVTASGTVAYVTERSGNLLRVDLTGDNANRSTAVVVGRGMTAPHQIALDEERGRAYVVEFGGAGRLLRIDLEGPTAGNQTVITSGLSQALGLVVTHDFTTAYVSEQGAGRITRVDLATGARTAVASNLPGIFFLRWANDAQDSILLVQRDPTNALSRINLARPSDQPLRIVENLPALPSSVVVLPNDRYVVCCDSVLIIFSTTLLIPKISDVDGNLLVRHFQDELARWSQAGEVLEPHSKYRLKVVTTIRARGEGQLSRYSRNETMTEFAYFRTDGPPGVAPLTAPVGSDSSFESPLDDLSRYVRKTMPRVVNPTPEVPVSSRPFYRAYDIGIEFDENYVDLMYRLGRRDLSIHLHDGNGAIRDEEARRLVLANQWGLAEQVTLTDREERWLAVLGASGCMLIDMGAVVRNSTFSEPSEAHVLPPSSLCEARLIPALLHDDFGSYPTNTGANGPGGSFERWQVQDASGSAPSRWQINSEGTPPDLMLAQINNANTMLVYKNAPDLPQDHPEQPANWTHYRLTVQLRFSEGRIGVVWRYRDAGHHYRFVMDRQAGKRELIRVSGGAPTPLATKSFTPNQASHNYTIAVEVVGSSMRVYQDGSLVFAVDDSMITAGTVGVHCAGTTSARFSDIYVDDFRTTAPVVYSFSFLTSRFTNFADHLGSFEGKTWRAEIPATANVAPLIAAAAMPSSPASEAESRASEALRAQLPAVTASTGVRATRVEQSGSAIAFLIQSPEPMDWRRIDVHVFRAPLNTGTYTPVTARVLRKADGAGLFIVSPASNSAGSLLPPGEYRLSFTYRRNNRAFDPDSDLLSEAGHTTPEEASLNIPWQTQQ